MHSVEIPRYMPKTHFSTFAIVREGRIGKAATGEADLAKKPALKLSTIAADPVGLSKILAALNWTYEQIADQPLS